MTNTHTHTNKMPLLNFCVIMQDDDYMGDMGEFDMDGMMGDGF